VTRFLAGAALEKERTMGMPGPWELLIILVIVIAIFGAGRLAGIGGALGGGIREFKKAIKDDDTPAADANAKKAEGEQKA
jgi:sec-independent protein translocase protein TatA